MNSPMQPDPNAPFFKIGDHVPHAECPNCGVRAIYRTFRGFSCDNCGAKFSPARWGSKP